MRSPIYEVDCLKTVLCFVCEFSHFPYQYFYFLPVVNKNRFLLF